MADEKKVVAEKQQKNGSGNTGDSKFQKVIGWFAKLPARIAKPFKSMYYELKKVTWPSKQKLIAYSVIVLVFMLFMGVVIGLLDMGASALVKWLAGIAA